MSLEIIDQTKALQNIAAPDGVCFGCGVHIKEFENINAK